MSEEEECLGPCYVNGHGDSSGKVNHPELLTAMGSNESLVSMYKLSGVGVQGSPWVPSS